MSINFKNWLKTSSIRDMDTIKGDLTRAIINDDEFPEIDNLEIVMEYMKSRLIVPNTDLILKELKDLYICYQKVVNPH